MQRFRAVDEIASDDELIAALRTGESDWRERWRGRYGGPIAATVAHRVARVGEVGGAVTADQVAGLVEHVLDSLPEITADPSPLVEPGSDPVPAVLEAVVRAVPDAASEGGADEGDFVRWQVRNAIDRLTPERRSALRRVALDGDPSSPEVDRLVDRIRSTAGFDVDGSTAADEDTVWSALTSTLTWVDPSSNTVPAGTKPDEGVAAGAGHVADAGGSLVADPATETRPDRSERRGRSPLVLVLGGAAAAVVVLFIVLAGFSAADERTSRTIGEADLVPTGVIPDVEGSASIVETDDGVVFTLDANLPPRSGGELYRATLVLADGSTEQLATFREADDVALVTGVPLDTIDLLRVTTSSVSASTAGVREEPLVLRLDVVAVAVAGAAGS